MVDSSFNEKCVTFLISHTCPPFLNLPRDVVASLPSVTRLIGTGTSNEASGTTLAPEIENAGNRGAGMK
jgi:hypothetical protein